MKYFIITIDTEGDNLWEWKQGLPITTENTKYLQRFQNLCNCFGFQPVYLSNWEVINDPYYVDFIEQNLAEHRCELGMHLHAWNTPPLWELQTDKNSAMGSGAPYLIEYPENIMEEKIKTMTDKMQEQFGFVPVTHRAGRWGINRTYFKLLGRYGYRYDCSITPGINWCKSIGQTIGCKGPDYRREAKSITERQGIIELPLLTKHTHRMFWHVSEMSGKEKVLCLLKDSYHCIKGKTIWIRPNGKNLKEMLYMVRCMIASDQEYLMFMLHSSELMPGGSPSFPSSGSIDKLYKDMKILFEEISKNCIGITVQEFLENRKVWG